ncbi:MAG: PKD domain-containing protein, partial [Pseudomonadota bacterium]
MNNAVRRCVTLAIGLLVLTGCQSDTKSSPGAVASAPHVVRPVHRADEVLVKLRPGLAAAKAGIVTLGKRAVSVRRLAPEGGHLRGHLDRWMRVALPPGMDVKTALAQLLLDPDVERVEPNYLVHTTAVPSDPSFSLQWGLRNTGANGGAPGADIDAVPAWDLQTGSASVVIAVIDTGVDIVHPDLADNIWINPGEIADNGIDDDGNGYADDVHGYDFLAETGDVSDTNGHGTNVASIAAAVGNNGVGVAGVAWGARIMPLKFADQNGAGDIADAVRAIAYAVENGARIINASWGGYGESEALRDAAAAATAAGALVVAGAGNDGSDNDVTPFYPASFEDVISVAATTPLDAKAAFSNFGRNSVDLGAPGEDIFGAFPEGRYAYFSGTSMAAPHVSGAAALLLAQLPDLTVSGLKALLLDRAEQTVAMRGVTGTSARLNAANALDCDENTVVMGVRTPADAFAVLAGDPTLVRVQLTRCGQAATGYQAEATFANGDTALTLFDDGLHGDAAADDGIYANYWVPQSITQNSSVTLTASSASGADLTRTLNGHVRQRVRYQHQEVPYDWIDTSAGTTYTLGDDDSITVPIGFTFDFYGLPRDTLNISANGLLTFGAPEGTAGNGRLPDPAFPNDVIAVLWDDLDPTTGSVSVLVQGTSPSRAFTVSWMNVSRLGAAGTVSFQATLYEGSNDIVLAWQNVVFGSAEYDYGGNAVVGVEDPDGLDATVFVYRQRLLEDASARRFYVVPAEPELAYRVTVTTSPIRAGGGKLVASVVDGDGANNNYFNILEFTSDGDVILNPALTGDASGSFLPGPAYIGDAAFANLISQAVIFGNELRFLLRVSRNGLFEPFPDSFALYLLDSADQPYPTTDPLGTDALFAIEIDRPQPFPLVFESAYASATVETVGAPTARPGGPYAGKVGSPVVFDGGASSDPENDPLSFAWDFGDGNSAGGATPSHTYSERGLYTVSLTVSDGALYSAPATARVSISLSQPPIADAGVDQTVNQLVQVTLDGGGSGDSDGVVVGYAWRQIAGPAVTLQGAGSQVATFVSPRVEVQTRLTFELTVQDDAGDSNTDTVDVTVLKNNLVPTADAGPDQSVDEGAAVLIDGSGSSDPDGWIQTYAWQQIAGPSTFLTAPNPGQLSFTAPSVAVDSVMTFEFTVTDNEGASATDTVDVVVRNTNDPIANAGPDQTVDERSSVTLDGTASADPDGTIQGYAWEQIGGYVVSVADANTATPSFTAPLVPEDSLLRFRLTVNDNDGLTGSDTVDVFVRNAEVPPTADAGPDQAVDERSQVTLTGAASSDPDGTIVAYAWTQSAGPAVTLSSASSASATFTAPAVSADTSLTFLLTVTDDDGLTGTDTVDVLVRNVVVPPTADAGADQTVDQGTSVTLSGSGSADPDGSIAAYAWMQTAGPAVTLTGANAVSASFTAPIVAEDTVLTFELIVTDNDGATASDAVDVTVRRVNAQPVADAGPDQITVEGQTVQLAGSGTDTDGTIVQHQWAQWGGVPVSLTGADTPSPDFVAPEVASTAVLRFRLTVTDNEGATADDFVDITVFDREY